MQGLGYKEILAYSGRGDVPYEEASLYLKTGYETFRETTAHLV